MNEIKLATQGIGPQPPGYEPGALPLRYVAWVLSAEYFKPKSKM